jgi:hypothetical protein
MIEYFLSKGIDPNAETCTNKNALEVAFENKHIEAVNFLL